jgi:nitrogen fixation/metabolism regulation signal transduction histidine kinase
MHSWPHKISILQKPRFIPLRYRFIIMTSCILIFLLGTLALVLGFLQSSTIRGQIEKRGLSIAQSLAAASMSNLLTYNYVAIERSANQAAHDPDIVHVIIHDKEGRVAGYSGRPDLQNKFLKDDVSRNALAAMQLLIQDGLLESSKVPVLDVAVPVFLSDSADRWGTIRVSLSLAPMYQQIRQTQWIILSVGLVALVFGILVSMWAAQRVTHPLENLVHATIEAARGKLNRDIYVRTGDEVEILASNFSLMIREIHDHREQLELQLAEIKRLQRHTEKLLTTMSDGLLSVDMAGKVATINPAAQTMLRISENGHGKDRSVAELFKEGSALYVYIQDMLQNPHGKSQQEISLHKEEETQILLVGSSILRDEDGHPQEIILTLHDITELKKLEARIRQAERLAALGTLAAGMSHEIRNPLSAIKTFVQLLPRKIDKPGFLEKFQRTVPREINRINELVEDLLDLARAPKYHFAMTDIKSLLKHTVEFLGEELQANHIKYLCDFSDDLPLIWADADQLTKAFHNLVQNAVQAMETGGRLVIEAFSEKGDPPQRQITTSRNGWVILIFQDTGPGIPPEIIENIFNPFFTTKDKGTGLGLAITHKVITEHGGRIEVTSHAENGTRFTIGLPALMDPSHE